jgi:hypothetical protein
VRQKIRRYIPKKCGNQGKSRKLLKYSFIYPVPLTEWVSNIVPVTKKQGTIHVCVDYRDINKACPKENYPTPFIDQIINNCARSVILIDDPTQKLAHHCPALPKNLCTKLLLPATACADLALTATAEM